MTMKNKDETLFFRLLIYKPAAVALYIRRNTTDS